MENENELLNSLFHEARNQEVSTSHHEVGRWIGYFSLAALMGAWLTKFKVLFTKTYFMYTAVLLSVTLGVGMFLYNSDSREKIQNQTSTLKINIENPAPSIQNPIPKAEFSSVQQPQLTPSLGTSSNVDHGDQSENLGNSEVINSPDEVVDYAPSSKSVNYKDYGSFTKLAVSDAIRVILVQDGVQGVRLAEGVDESLLKISNKSGTLVIEQKTTRNNNTEIKVYVSVLEISGILLSDASRLSSDSTLNFKRLDIACSDAARVDLNLQAKTVNVVCSDASRINLMGKAENLDIVSSDASRVAAFGLICKHVNVLSSDASRIEVYTTESLNVKSQDATKVEYKGKPKTINQDSKMPAKVERAD